MRLIAALVTRNPAALNARSVQAIDFFTRRCRFAVRGFFLSRDQSLNRLKSIAAVRARTMHARTRSNVRKVGRPFAATRSAPKAKGRAKTVCEKRISRRTRVMTLGRGSVLSSTAMSPKRLADSPEKLLQTRARAGENRCPVREKHAIKSVIEEFP